MTAFGLPSPQKPQQEAVKSPVVIPLVKSPSPEPAEFETRRVSNTLHAALDCMVTVDTIFNCVCVGGGCMVHFLMHDTFGTFEDQMICFNASTDHSYAV